MKIDGNILLAECTTYDFKRELERQKKGKWLKSVSAFANTAGGKLFFGVDDDASIVGLENAQKDGEFISQAINEHLDPIPVFSLEPVPADKGKTILVLDVAAGNQTPYFLSIDGRKLAYVRSGNESIPATSHQLFNLVLKGSNKSWDSLASVEERSKYSFTFLEKEYNERSGAKWEESLLVSFGLVTEDGFLTNAGLLFADNCPIKQSRVYCTKWNGLYKDNSINDAEFQGNLLMNLRDAKMFIKANTATPWFKLPDYRLNLPEYSDRAIEEMLVNHLIHRDYTDYGAEVAVNIYEDRIETTSPGGIKDSSELVDIIPSETASRRRNPVIAEVFAQLRYMEKRGSGLRKIIDSTALLPTYKEDRKPFFRSSRTFFYSTVPNVNYGMSQDDLETFATASDLVENRPDTTQTVRKNRPESEKTAQTKQKNRPEAQKTAQTKIGKTAQSILDILVANPQCTRAELCTKLGKADGTVKEHLAKLQEKGIIERIGADFGGYWKVHIRK